MKKYLFLIFLLSINAFATISDSETAIKKANELKLAETEQWLRFLHYDHNWFYKTSEADGKTFFASPEGKHDPKKELEATIAGLMTGEKISEDSFLCRFPARARWLKGLLDLDEKYFPFKDCVKYTEFVQQHAKHTAYLVFSSYYLESPASAFGHTMIRLGNPEQLGASKHEELLSTGIGYAANNMTENALLYAFLGIVGGFQGTYSSIPYFYKIREYNDFESRDLWSYELNLTEEQKFKFLDHLWELGQTYFDYFYFSENCSYNLLTLLDAVNPEWKLKSKIPYYVMPIDSVKAVAITPGLVKSVSWRPSIKKIFEKSFSILTKEEQKKVLEAVATKNYSYVDTLPEERRVFWADAVIDLVDYKYSKEVLLEAGPYYEWKKQLLNKRSTLGINPNPSYMLLTSDDRPDYGHGTSRIEAGASLRDKKNVSGLLNIRLAMHDFMDPLKGQPALASLNFFEFSFKYNIQKKGEPRKTPFQVNSFKFFEIATLNPWTAYHKPVSLLAELGFKKHESCLEYSGMIDCMMPYFSGGMGVTRAVTKASISLLARTDVFYSSRYNNDFKLGVGPSIIALYRPTESWAFGTDLFWARDLANQKDYYRHSGETRFYFNQIVGLKLKDTYQDKYWKHDLSLLYYF